MRATVVPMVYSSPARCMRSSIRLAAFSLICALAAAVPMAPSFATTPRSPITLRLMLPERTLTSGKSIQARVVVTNSSVRSVSMGTTCPGAEFEVGLINRHVHFIYISDLGLCYGLRFHPGSTTVPVTIMASDQRCGGNSGVRCSASGLPPGKYETTVLTQGFPVGTKVPAPMSVVVRGHTS